jgi:hypothetical protein
MTVDINNPHQGFSLCVTRQDNPLQNHSGIWKPQQTTADAEKMMLESLRSLYAPFGQAVPDLSPDIEMKKPEAIRYK